jgi:hypothetical protein
MDELFGVTDIGDLEDVGVTAKNAEKVELRPHYSGPLARNAWSFSVTQKDYIR